MARCGCHFRSWVRCTVGLINRLRLYFQRRRKPYLYVCPFSPKCNQCGSSVIIHRPEVTLYMRLEGTYDACCFKCGYKWWGQFNWKVANNFYTGHFCNRCPHRLQRVLRREWYGCGRYRRSGCLITKELQHRDLLTGIGYE